MAYTSDERTDMLIAAIRETTALQTQVLRSEIGRVADSVEDLDRRLTDKVLASESVSKENQQKLDSLTKKLYFMLGGAGLLDGLLHLFGKK